MDADHQVMQAVDDILASGKAFEMEWDDTIEAQYDKEWSMGDMSNAAAVLSTAC